MQLRALKDGSWVKTFPLEVGSLAGISGRKNLSEMFYKFTSFLTPGTIYHCDLTNKNLESTVREVCSTVSYSYQNCAQLSILIQANTAHFCRPSCHCIWFLEIGKWCYQLCTMILVEKGEMISFSTEMKRFFPLRINLSLGIPWYFDWIGRIAAYKTCSTAVLNLFSL